VRTLRYLRAVFLGWLKLAYQLVWLALYPSYFRGFAWHRIERNWPEGHPLSRSQPYRALGFAVVQVPFSKVHIASHKFFDFDSSGYRPLASVSAGERLSLSREAAQRVSLLTAAYTKNGGVGSQGKQNLGTPAGILHPSGAVKLVDGRHRALAQWLIASKEEATADGIEITLVVTDYPQICFGSKP